MSNVLSYKGYHGTVEYSSDDGLLVGSVIGVRDSLNFHGSSTTEIEQSFHDCIDGYLEMCAEFGKEPDKEYKGSFNVRVSPDLHRSADLAAKKAGVSLNQFVQDAISEKLNGDHNSSPVYISVDHGFMEAVASKRAVFDTERYGSSVNLFT